MEGKINHIYTCTYPTKHVGDGKIRLEGTCATRDGPAIPISGAIPRRGGSQSRSRC